MNQGSDIINPLLDSSIDNKNKETANQENPSAKTEESKEEVSMGDYEEEFSNISLQEEFFFDSGQRKIVSVAVVLKSNALYINLLDENERPENWYINPKDLVGASTIFPKKKIRFSPEEITEVYELKEKVFYHTNLDIVTKWSDLILNISKEKDYLKNFGNKSINLVQVYAKKSLLVLVNPRGGSGKARQICNRVSPNLEKCGYELDVVSTQHHRHAYELIKNMDQNKLLTYFAIVTISGDGLSHEVMNGIFHREDWEKIKDIPIGFIPGGSGNAMAKNVCYFSKEESLLENMIYIMGKGEKRELDVLKFEIEGEKTVYAMLSFSWALIADVDLESEVIRCCGGSRFVMWAVIRWLRLRRYRARFSYTSEEVNLNGFGEDLLNNEKKGWVHVDDPFVHFFIGNVPFISQSDNISPLSKTDDGFMDLQMMRSTNNVGRWKTLKFLLRIDSKGSVINYEEKKPWENSGMEYYKIKAFRLEPYGNSLGKYSIDGESYPVKKMQGTVLPKAIKIISLI